MKCHPYFLLLLLAGVQIFELQVTKWLNPMIKNPIVCTESCHGKTIKVTTTDTLVIELAVQLGTGYSWMEASATEWKAANQALTEEAVTPGQPQYQRFYYTNPKQKGKYTLHLNYKRAWEESFLKTFVVTIKVS